MVTHLLICLHKHPSMKRDLVWPAEPLTGIRVFSGLNTLVDSSCLLKREITSSMFHLLDSLNSQRAQKWRDMPDYDSPLSQWKDYLACTFCIVRIIPLWPILRWFWLKSPGRTSTCRLSIHLGCWFKVSACGPHVLSSLESFREKVTIATIEGWSKDLLVCKWCKDFFSLQNWNV